MYLIFLKTSVHPEVFLFQKYPLKSFTKTFEIATFAAVKNKKHFHKNEQHSSLRKRVGFSGR